MNRYGLNELREKYLSFFEGKGHLRLPSFSLVPQNDPSLLLINSGMAPLKPYFTGAVKPPSKRVTTCQKCVRTPDIENVGKTARHGTFFEMLGNFSFGDYFKKEVIPWAWEFVRIDLGIPEDKLWVTVFEDDNEAYEIWRDSTGISEDRIVRMGKEDNFWEHGTGPCGPCSEIFYDRGPARGCGKAGCKVGCSCDRYVEFWNLVFTQFDKDEKGNYKKLPNPNIDTGMGLERLACIIQDVNNLFEVDTVRKILDLVCSIAGKEYGNDDKDDISIRVVTDHIRSTVMMISDGIIPSNEGRGYVLRRLLRRAARHGKLLGIQGHFLCMLAGTVIAESKAAYPELEERADFIDKVIKVEEERFAATVDLGLSLLNDILAGTKAEGRNELEGSTVFKLHDTYGFPVDLTREISLENGITIDMEGFQKEMSLQRNKAREALKNKSSSAWGTALPDDIGKDFVTVFKGYDNLSCSAAIEFIVKNNETVDFAAENDDIALITGETVFYAEGGGQAGDTGTIEGKGFIVQVEDTKKTGDGKYLHIGKVKKGIVIKGSEALLSVDSARRMATARNHTSTHLLHKALRSVLGTHIAQAGSYVDGNRLRFDFNHFSPVTDAELEKVEAEINSKIFEGLNVDITEMALSEARKTGVTALFDEKYGDTVRVVKIGDYSSELCGGTHIANTSQAGLLRILGESGVAAGVRRIEAVTGTNALEYFACREKLLNETAGILKCNPEDVAVKSENLTAELKNLKKELDLLRQKAAGNVLENLIGQSDVFKGVKLISGRIDGLDAEEMRNSADMLRTKGGVKCVVILAGLYDEKVVLVAAATKDAVSAGIHSGNIIREAAKAAGGGGGGRPDMAQAGGRDTGGIAGSLAIAVEVAKKQIQ